MISSLKYILTSYCIYGTGFRLEIQTSLFIWSKFGIKSNFKMLITRSPKFKIKPKFKFSNDFSQKRYQYLFNNSIAIATVDALWD